MHYLQLRQSDSKTGGGSLSRKQGIFLLLIIMIGTATMSLIYQWKRRAYIDAFVGTAYMDTLKRDTSLSDLEKRDKMNNAIQSEIVLYNARFYPDAETMICKAEKPKNIKKPIAYLVGENGEYKYANIIYDGDYNTLFMIFNYVTNEDFNKLAYLDIVDGDSVRFDYENYDANDESRYKIRFELI